MEQDRERNGIYTRMLTVTQATSFIQSIYYALCSIINSDTFTFRCSKLLEWQFDHLKWMLANLGQWVNASWHGTLWHCILFCIQPKKKKKKRTGSLFMYWDENQIKDNKLWYLKTWEYRETWESMYQSHGDGKMLNIMGT